MRRVALITGITGQDGSYLAELLLARGYRVHGLLRPAGSSNLERIERFATDLELHDGDLTSEHDVNRLVSRVRPTEVYHLAADTFVPASWEHPIASADATAMGVVRMLEATRQCVGNARFLQASTSEMFGNVTTCPQDESTAFCPRNPYAASKLYGHWMTVNYRERYRMFAVSAIMFNHESPRRSPDFVSRKITRTAVAIKMGWADELRLGNLQARRDWGFAGDYVRAMWQMLSHTKPEDFVVGTGNARTVEDFVAATFRYLDLDWQDYVVIDPKFYRPAEPNVLMANPAKARRLLGWEPETSFEELVRMMVDADLAAAKQHATCAPQSTSQSVVRRVAM